MSTELDVLKDIRRILKKILRVQLMPYKSTEDSELPTTED